MKIVVLAGGMSTERTVSLVSGTEICRALRRRGHQAVLIDMFLGLEGYSGPAEEIFDAPDGLCSGVSIGTSEPDRESVRRGRKDQSPSLLGQDVLRVCAMADIVFLGLHGQGGEDGRIQATLDLLGVPYTGSGYLAAAMAMDKAVCKQVMDTHGIRTPAWRDFTYGPEDIDRLTAELSVPCALKVVNGGSSLGVYLPDTKEELRAGLTDLLKYGNHAVAEEKIRGRELTVGVLGDRYLPAVEILPAAGYFDYAAKYQPGGSRELCPAPVTESEQRQMGEAALALHRALGLAVYSRSDFLLDDQGRAWCLEVNTLPGMTPASLVPKEAAAVGMSYEDLCEEIVRQSLPIKRR